MTLILRATHSGSTSVSRTRGRDRKWSLTCSTWWNPRVSSTRAWKCWPIQRRNLSRSSSAGTAQAKTLLITKTTIGESKWRTISDVTTPSHSPTTLSMIMIPSSLPTPNHTPIRIWWMTLRKSRRRSWTMSLEIHYAEPWLETGAIIWLSPPDQIITIQLHRRKELSSVQGCIRANQIVVGWWRVWLTSW